MRQLYISDTHFGHKGVITMDKRPFSSIEEMDEEMIFLWNQGVERKDIVYIIGDFSWYNKEKTTQILKRLKGRKHLISGNHDKTVSTIKECFDSISPYKELKINKKKIILCHYFIPFYNGHFSGGVMLHGHSHQTKEHFMELLLEEKLNREHPYCFCYNVGAMMPYMNYTPKTLEEIITGKEVYLKELKEKNGMII